MIIKRYIACILLLGSLLMLTCIYIPTVVEYYLKSEMYVAFGDVALLLFIISLALLYDVKILKGKWFVMLTIATQPIRCSHIMYASYFRNVSNNESSYYVNVAVFNNPHIWGQNKGVGGHYRTDCYSVENGRQLTIDRYHTLNDTILVKMSLNDFIICITNLHPSAADIQKYMEPVLFIDNVEQPRPEYDDLRLSADERRKLLYKYRFRAVPVVKKERDKFLRNLVTFQINDTLQRTVNLMYKDEKDFEDIFDSLEKNSRVIVKVSEINPKIIEVVNWRPTESDIKNLVPNIQIDKALEQQLLSDSASVKLLERYAIEKPATEKISDSNIATVVSMDKKKFKRNLKTVTRYYVQIEDSLFRSEPIELDETKGHIYYKLSKGSKVIYRKKKGGEVEVLNWHPTREEKEKYKTPVKLVEKK